MRTNIEIDDGLMAEAMKAGSSCTKREAVEAGLRLIKRQADYRKILKLRARSNGAGAMKTDWTASPT